MEKLEASFLTRLLDILLSRGGNYAEIYYEEEDLFSFVLENNLLKTIKTGEDRGLHLRLIRADKTFSVVSSDLNQEKLLVQAQNLIESIAQGEALQSAASRETLYTGKVSPVALAAYEPIVDGFFRTGARMMDASALIAQATLSYYKARKRIWIVNSEGLIAQDDRDYERYTVHAVAKEGSEVQTAYEGPGVSGGADLFSKFPLEESSDQVVRRAILMLGAKSAPTGKMPVVLRGISGGTMIHEACGHALEADFIYKDTSIFNKRVGQQVASECVTVVDDGSLPGLFGSFGVDDEGIRPSRTVLIENGVLRGYMTDRLYGGLLGLPLTGNGRRESYHSKPVPRMSNTFIEDTTDDPGEIIDSVEQGILVNKMGGGQVNITNGEFIFEVAEGYLIEKGKIGSPIKGASLIGNGPAVLMDIERVGSDKTFIPGICGKYDCVPVGDAQPTLKIRELVIGGK